MFALNNVYKTFQGCYVLLLLLPAQSTPAFVAVPANIHRSAAQNLRCVAQPAVFDANKCPFFGNAECRVCVFWIGCREELPVNTTYSQIAFAALHLKTGNHQRHLKTDFTEATHLLRWLCFYLAELPVAAQGKCNDAKARVKAKREAGSARPGWRAPSAAHRPAPPRHLPHGPAPRLSGPATASRRNACEMTTAARSTTGVQTWPLPNGDPLLANFYINGSHHGKAFATRQDEMGAFGRQ